MGPARGLRFVHQDMGVFPDLSVAENLALATTYPTRAAGAIDWRSLHHRADVLLDRFAIEAAPDTSVGALQPAAVVLFAIARALQDARESRGSSCSTSRPRSSPPTDRERVGGNPAHRRPRSRRAVREPPARRSGRGGRCSHRAPGWPCGRRVCTRTELTESRLAELWPVARRVAPTRSRGTQRPDAATARRRSRSTAYAATVSVT